MRTVFLTKADAEAYLLKRHGSFRDPDTGCIWARDPDSQAMGKCYFTPSFAFTTAGKRVPAFTVKFGA